MIVPALSPSLFLVLIPVANQIKLLTSALAATLITPDPNMTTDSYSHWQRLLGPEYMNKLQPDPGWEWSW